MQGSNLPQPNDSMVGKLLVASTRIEDPVLSRSVCLVVHEDPENVFAVLLNRPMATPPQMVNSASPNGQAGDANGAPGAPQKKPRFQIPNASQQTEPNSPDDSYPSPDSTDTDSTTLTPGQLTSEQSAQKAADAAMQAAMQAAKSLGEIHFGGPLAGPLVAVHDSSEHAEAAAGKGIYVAAQREMLETLLKDRPESMRLIVGHLGWSVEQLRSEYQSGYWHVIDATPDDIFVDDQQLWPTVIRRATTNSLCRWIGVPDQPFSAQVN